MGSKLSPTCRINISRGGGKTEVKVTNGKFNLTKKKTLIRQKPQKIGCCYVQLEGRNKPEVWVVVPTNE